jgi:hypothetical protein
MSALDDLAPDQRAVLQLVLQRGRSYDDIAQLLSIDRAAVRQRALDAFDALTPATVLPGPEQALVTDYLLGQLPEKVAEQVYSFLQASDADRAWALAIVDVITPLVSHSLPEIPVGGLDPARPADDLGAGGLERDSDSLTSAAAFPPEDEPYESDQSVPSAPAAEGLLPPVASATWQDPEFEFGGEDRPSSRRGGAILLVIVAVVIAAAVVIAVATSGSPAKHPVSAANSTTAGQTTHTSTTGTTGTTSTTGTTTTAATTTPQILAQLNLTSPTGASSTLGIAQVVRDAGVTGIVIDAQGVPPNTSHNAYAVWLYNSPSSHKFVGFVPNLVGANGKLATEGRLPPHAASYHHVLITLETQSKPTSPGEVVLSGTFSEHP